MHLIRQAASDQRGFTLITVIMTMMVVSMLGVGAYAATTGDMPIARKDQDRKRAYEAAQAGIDWYMNQLRSDPDYWRKCKPATATPGEPITNEGDVSDVWQKVEDVAGGDTADSRFRIQVMKKGSAACDPTKPAEVLDEGKLWIRSVGQANGRQRAVLGAFQQQSEFLKYLYFSNWESLDPQLNNASGLWPAGSNRNQCDYVRKTRDVDSAPQNQFGQIICVTNAFIKDDVITGSVHTNDDSISYCGATIGRGADKDVLEVANAKITNWRTDRDGARNGDTASYKSQEYNAYACPSGSGSVTDDSKIAAKIVAPAETLQLPPSNVGLKKYASGSYLIKGQTCIEFTATGMNVYPRGVHQPWGNVTGGDTPHRVDCSGTPTPLAMPSSGVVYVQNDDQPCTPRLGHNGFTSYTSSASCGDVAVSGTYNGSVTIAAENDIIINGNLERGSASAMLGLIANNYVRVYQPLTGDPYEYKNQETQITGNFLDNSADKWPCKSFKNHPDVQASIWASSEGRMGPVSGFTPVSKIQASILSMQHTFSLDNPGCEDLGTLDFEGSISSYWGVNLNGSIHLAPADCKTGRPIVEKDAWDEWIWTGPWPWDGYWKHHAGTWGSYETIWGLGIGIFVESGKVKCGPALFEFDTKAGYSVRDWKYDTRLAHDQPPHFIAPLNSDGRWIINRRTEQVCDPDNPDPIICSPTPTP